jgi:hypothetical protein
LQDCHERRALEVIQEAEQGQIYIEQATVRLLESTAKKELDSSKPQQTSVLLLGHVKAFKGYARVFLGRNRYHVLREIPTIGFVGTGLKRVATDSLDSSAQVAFNFQCMPYSYVLATSCVQVIEQDIIQLCNRRHVTLISRPRKIEWPA